ncbi:lysine--tRNA ligase [Natronomonas pharaonis DSM 2160]|uniref:Lysine--tRNA ligase n=1 Tax=Natronomonas pharaonis (strain ATCC 35678 / DSM 2160 / CIP 103997 / JCM 8858 / NBRC 14720 / NCIMB 2260 / Gabara) TaxID=348780 RepID=SYK_NATPD|nr:lysine--tRNA ligase [Natronomonas pharaonis]Q3IRL7.1 RecName: Full=Lysine--tRNA ligase; AltName: Full=Lysyl-tRNA synthetase; Short=LysRS [Natronomonas pharaonis DSM 2160]CAI49226.1 lysine--tRNA ligase [Natronomonas pharaonis DSM 2160]
MSDLYDLGTGEKRPFWADAAADEVEARDPDEPVTIKGGVSPSGVPHLGHFNEIMRGYFVAEALRERGYEVRQVFTTDDKDRLRKLPRKLADLDWNVVGLGEVDAGALGRNLGRPYTDIPDPFGCCDSYGAHFTELLRRSAEAIGVPIDLVSNTELYAGGDFDAAVEDALANRDTAREVLSEFQDKVDDEYVPFFPQCAECGLLTETVTDIDLDDGTVGYVCSDVEAGDDVIEGCGHEGRATFRAGKLPWRFEWPAQWRVLGVDFEPFGKDHAEGSWPSGKAVSREVFDTEPPVPMVYEWFTLNGDALSSSAGNIITVDEVLELLEPAVLRYFFTKNPKKQRDFDVSNLDRFVDEFDRFEAGYFGDESVEDDERARADRAYPMVVDELPERQPVRIPYTFAAVLGMTDDRDLRLQMAQRSGHIPDDATDDQIERALERVEKARAWAVRTDNEFNYRLAETLPAVDFDAETAAALDELAAFVETESPDDETLQGEIYETAKRNDVDVGDLFSAGYRLFLDESEGPRLGPLLSAMDETFVVERLRREG